MGYNWTEQAFFPAERNALIRELEKDITAGLLTKEQAEEKIRDWDAYIDRITHPTEEELQQHRKDFLEKYSNEGGESYGTSAGDD